MKIRMTLLSLPLMHSIYIFWKCADNIVFCFCSSSTNIHRQFILHQNVIIPAVSRVCDSCSFARKNIMTSFAREDKISLTCGENIIDKCTSSAGCSKIQKYKQFGDLPLGWILKPTKWLLKNKQQLKDRCDALWRNSEDVAILQK